MKTRVVPSVAILVTLSALASVLLTLPVYAQTTNGRIEGQVANGTKNAAPASTQNLTVRMFGIDAGGTQPISATTQSDASGKFSFSNLDTNPTTKYLITTIYSDVDYYSNALAFEGDKTQLSATVTVYETTTDASVLRVEQTHLIFDVRTRVFSVAQIVVVQNTNDRTLVSGANRSTLLLPILAGAQNVQFNRPDEEQTTIRGDGMLTYTLPFLPGGDQIIYTYVLPFTPPTFQFNLQMPFDSTRVRVLLADVGGSIQSSQFAPTSQFQAQANQKYLLTTAEQVKRGTLLKATFVNLPESIADPTRPANQSEPIVAGIVFGLSALLCMALLIYPIARRRGANA